ncbi:hypothetical protein SADUNF_Sadunf09G0030300 [Salix dunnii]|uniref:Uncharacterized protein n=1 Tax=Salix dunnii TaxID=1413687 RepID=A0A835JS11_9ROSI|nr:hypothetical protein SADUNF_Sadunf09G0030300 [Salix dunnii]
MPAALSSHFNRDHHFSASSGEISLSGETGAHMKSSVSECLPEIWRVEVWTWRCIRTTRLREIVEFATRSGLETREQQCGVAIEWVIWVLHTRNVSS